MPCVIVSCCFCDRTTCKVAIYLYYYCAMISDWTLPCSSTYSLSLTDFVTLNLSPSFCGHACSTCTCTYTYMSYMYWTNQCIFFVQYIKGVGLLTGIIIVTCTCNIICNVHVHVHVCETDWRYLQVTKLCTSLAMLENGSWPITCTVDHNVSLCVHVYIQYVHVHVCTCYM